MFLKLLFLENLSLLMTPLGLRNQYAPAGFVLPQDNIHPIKKLESLKAVIFHYRLQQGFLHLLMNHMVLPIPKRSYYSERAMALSHTEISTFLQTQPAATAHPVACRSLHIRQVGFPFCRLSPLAKQWSAVIRIFSFTEKASFLPPHPCSRLS